MRTPSPPFRGSSFGTINMVSLLRFFLTRYLHPPWTTAPVMACLILMTAGLLVPAAAAQDASSSTASSSNASYTLSGYVVDAPSGEKLIGAHLYARAADRGATTNRYGFFSMTLPAGPVEVVVSYLGYRPDTLRATMDRDLTRTVELEPATIEVGQVEVVGTRETERRTSTAMSVETLPPGTFDTLPVIAGEPDVIKALQLLPGIRSGSEGSSGLYVRGGGPGQNLILLDGAPLYNASHLFGFLSVFNTDVVNDVSVTKGGFPARYGGRLSSVVEVSLDEGNMRETEVDGAVGLVASRLAVQGPIQKGKTSYVAAGRRTYVDLLARPFMEANERGGYYFYDLNAKVNHVFSDRNRVFLSTYLGDDRLYFKDEGTTDFGLGWGNLTSTLRWNHLASERLFVNTTLLFSRYRFQIDASSTNQDDDTFSLNYDSGITDLSAQVDADFAVNPTHYLRFGGALTHHTFEPGATVLQDTGTAELDTTLAPSETERALEGVLYAEDDVRITDRLKANLGLHLSAFLVDARTYGSIQPRVSARYLVTDQWTLKSSYAAMRQYVHLLSNSTVGLPTDLWVPATDDVRPQVAHQVAAGVVRGFGDGRYELTVEGYYKTMNGLIEYQEGASFGPYTANAWEEQVTTGTGRSYGTELLLRKTVGATTGWVGYTLSRTDRQFDALNGGQRFPYRYDRRHDVSVVLSHRVSDGVTLSANWVYGTGDAMTLPRGEFNAQQDPLLTRLRAGEPRNDGSTFSRTITSYGTRNGYRMRAYHRLDLGIRFDWGDQPGRHALNLGVYNAYNRKNPFFVYNAGQEEGKAVLTQVSVFPILPSLNYSFSY